jgi:subtilisin family serine protease
MHAGEHIVLRDLSRIAAGDPFAGGGFRSRGVAPEPPPAMEVAVETLDARDVFELGRDPAVVGVAPSFPTVLIEPVAADDDGDAGEASTAEREAGETWGVRATGASASPFSGKGVVVAVLDTGIDRDHEAFAGVELIEQDFTGEGDGDRQGHGTHCAGTIFGRSTSGLRFGVAPGVERALIGKVLNARGSGTTGQIVQAMQWAMDNGAHVISMSLGMDFPGLVEELVDELGIPVKIATAHALESYRANVRLFDSIAALMRASHPFAQGTIVVAASGNESDHPALALSVAPPAVAEGFVSVGAVEEVGEEYRLARFSNVGANVCGPGVRVHSAKAGGGYVSFNGTSMATPHAAGVAAHWAERQLSSGRSLDTVQLLGHLIGRATTERFAAGFDPLGVGAGLVQAPRA